MQKEVFKGALEAVANKKRVSISRIMKEVGYAPSSCTKPAVVTKTKGWEELLAEVSDDGLLKELNNLSHDKRDKRAKLQAIDMLLKLKSKYPATKEIRELIDKRESIVEP